MVLHTVGELKAAGVPAASIRREQFDFAATPPSRGVNYLGGPLAVEKGAVHEPDRFTAFLASG